MDSAASRAASWEAEEGIPGSYVRRRSSGSLSPPLPPRAPVDKSPVAAGAGLGPVRGTRRLPGSEAAEARGSLDSAAGSVAASGGRRSSVGTGRRSGGGRKEGVLLARKGSERGERASSFSMDTSSAAREVEEGGRRRASLEGAATEGVGQPRRRRSDGGSGGVSAVDGGKASPGRGDADAGVDEGGRSRGYRKSRSRSESIVDNEGLLVSEGDGSDVLEL